MQIIQKAPHFYHIHYRYIKVTEYFIVKFLLGKNVCVLWPFKYRLSLYYPLWG